MCSGKGIGCRDGWDFCLCTLFSYMVVALIVVCGLMFFDDCTSCIMLMGNYLLQENVQTLLLSSFDF